MHAGIRDRTRNYCCTAGFCFSAGSLSGSVHWSVHIFKFGASALSRSEFSRLPASISNCYVIILEVVWKSSNIHSIVI